MITFAEACRRADQGRCRQCGRKPRKPPVILHYIPSGSPMILCDTKRCRDSYEADDDLREQQ